MAQKKSTSAKKTASRGKAQKRANNQTDPIYSDIFALVLVFFAVFVIFSLFAPVSAPASKWVEIILVELFGTFGSVILCLCLLAHAAMIFIRYPAVVSEDKGGIIYAGGFLLNIIFALADPTFRGYSVTEKSFYAMLVSTESRGGVIGGFLARLLGEYLSVFGAYLLVILLTLVCLMMVFKKSIAGIIAAKPTVVKNEKPPKTASVKALRAKEANSEPLFLLDAKTENKQTKKTAKRPIAANSESLRFSENDIIFSNEEPLPLPKKEPAEGESLFKDFGEITEKSAAGKKVRRLKANSARSEKAFGEEEALAKKPDEAEAKAKEKQTDAAGDAEKSLKKPVSEYTFPPLSLLASDKASGGSIGKAEVLATAANLEKTLSEFSVEAKVNNISMGPTVTRYELSLASGIRVSKVVGLSDDLAMALAAQRVRIEAPIPGKSAIGIEVPNKHIATVRFSSVVSSREFTQNRGSLAIALGKKLSGDNLIMDISTMPHLLIAGATGSGKSVCIHAIIASILYHSSPEDVRLVLIDPKMVELKVYEDIPHLLIPVVTDPKYAAQSLNWAVRTMTDRYKLLAENSVKDIDGYNAKMEKTGGEKMPRIVIIIDELSDLMMVSGKTVEAAICRIAQLARAAGIHLVLATQRPSVDVITGLIKANIPSRISFAVSSQIDSRTILDMTGAEKLLGKGDMLYYPTGEAKPLRAQCSFISEEETEAIADFVRKKTVSGYDEDVIRQIESGGAAPGAGSGSDESFSDELLPEAMQIAFEKGIISTSTIQRRLRLGYARAGRIVDEMEQRGYITAADGSRPRKVLITAEEFYGPKE